MELRGCTQLHFITVIRGGNVIKLPNLARGNPRLKFKNMEEIYSSYDYECHDSLAKSPPKVDRSLAMPCGFVEVKTEVKIEYIEEEDRLDFSAMTLRQIKDICKSHKRKASRSVNLITVKQDDDHRCEQDVLDLEETLSSWKHKVLMKRKTKKKGTIKCNSMSPTTNNLDGRLKGTSASPDLLDVSSKIWKPLNTKVEDAQHDCAQLQTRSLTPSDNPVNLTSDTVRAFEHCCPDQDLNTTSGYPQSGYLNPISHEHLVQPVGLENSICDLSQVSYEHLDCTELQNPLIYGNADAEMIVKLDSSVIIGDQPLVSCGSEASREEDMTVLMACDEPTEIGILESDSSIQNHYPHHSCPIQPPPDENPSSMVHVSVMALNSDYQTAKITNSGEPIESMDGNKDIENVVRRVATNYSSIVKFDNNLPSVSGMASLDNSIAGVEDQGLSVLDAITEEVPASPMGPKSYCHGTEFITNCEGSRSLVDILDPEEKAIRRDFRNCTVAVEDKNCLPLVNSVESLHNVTSAVEVKQSSILNDAITPLICSPEPRNAIDPQIGSAANKGCNEKKLEQQTPERLLSGRKTISPNSKERLRKAMNCAELQDDTQTLYCREKLFFEKNCVDTSSSRSNSKKARIILTSKGMEALRMTEIRTKNLQTLKKGKYERKASLIKGSVSTPRASPLSVRAASVCSSSQSCSQNAIVFSLQQMIDTERLATKLLTELQSMKEMVVDTLTCSASRYNNTDKARLAVENVKKVEESTKKFLSMMSRDCTRFCKIMELTETNGGSPVKRNDEHIPDSEICQNNNISETKQDEHKLSPPKSTVQKDKKIMFADEAGESLCQVRAL